MNNIEEQKSAEQVVIENKLNRINEGTSDIKKYAEKEERIRILATILKKYNILQCVPFVMSTLGILCMLLPIFINKTSMSVWTFIFDYGIPQKQTEISSLNNLDFSVYGSALYDFLYGKQVSETLSSIRNIEIESFRILSLVMSVLSIIFCVYTFIANSNVEMRIRKNYDSPLRKKSSSKSLESKFLSDNVVLGGKGVFFTTLFYFITYGVIWVFPVSFGIFLEGWFQGLMHINVFYYVLPAIFFIGGIVSLFFSFKFDKEHSQDIEEASAIYKAKF